MASTEPSTLAPTAPRDLGGGRGLNLVVMGPDLFWVQPLPEGGALTLGRQEDADIRLDDPMVSRKHVRLHLGAVLEVEDLGSANGTFLGDQRLGAGERVRLMPGEVLSVGGVLVTVHPRRTAPHPNGFAPRAAPPALPGDVRAADRLRVRGEAAPRADGARAPKRSSVVVLDPAMGRVYEMGTRAAAGTINILILGETGVGKEMLAEEIHRRSPRAGRPLLCLNCGAFSETLLESELFGHEKGAFTGAAQAKLGLLETAPGGTVFLDEVAEMSVATQAKLLRVIETKQVMRLGSLKAHPIDVRFLAATNRDLAAEVASGRFRRDLYFRLNGLSLFIPPLRERPAEIPALVHQFVRQACAELGRPTAPRMGAEATRLLAQYPWPGNIRELRNVIDRAVLLSDGDDIRPEHLALETSPATVSTPLAEGDEPTRVRPPSRPGAPPTPVRIELAALERQRIEDALHACAGNQSRAAAALGMPRRTLVKRLAEYGLSRPRGPRSPGG